MSETPSNRSRRDVLAAGTASIAALAGCAGFGAKANDTPALDRVLLRSDTGQVEPVRLTLVYAPPTGSTDRPIWGSHDASSSEEFVPMDDYDETPGFYSLTAYSENHDNGEVVSFNSHADHASGEDVQFEVVVQEGGDVWANVGHTGDDISVPGQ
ncbi:hypothetical protein [Halorussus halophilus]|uniref:hypothetical protein n=1 Tax=Halorussus halophilus TaxID=2650975 RepID=UPI0013017CF6|nr:hypothetical protein [Halorussus halophilus]